MLSRLYLNIFIWNLLRNYEMTSMIRSTFFNITRINDISNNYIELSLTYIYILLLKK